MRTPVPGLQNPYVECYIQDDEILISKGKYFITYQFHPESVGTTFRGKFMGADDSIIGK